LYKYYYNSWWDSKISYIKVDMNKSSWLCNWIIVLSLDLSKDHDLKKIMNNLNLLCDHTNVFCLLYISWYFSFVNTYIAVKSSIQFVHQRKNNIIQLFENANTTLRQWRMLFIKDYDFIHTRNLRFSNFKRRFFQQLNMKISQGSLIWRRVWR